MRKEDGRMKLKALFDMVYNLPDEHEIVYVDTETGDIYIHSNNFTLKISVDRDMYQEEKVGDVVRSIIKKLNSLSEIANGCYLYPLGTLIGVLKSLYIIETTELIGDQLEAFKNALDKRNKIDIDQAIKYLEKVFMKYVEANEESPEFMSGFNTAIVALKYRVGKKIDDYYHRSVTLPFLWKIEEDLE